MSITPEGLRLGMADGMKRGILGILRSRPQCNLRRGRGIGPETEGRGNRLHQSLQVFHAQLAIAQNLVQQSGSQRLTGVHGRHRTPAISVTEKTMAASDTNNQETAPRQRGDQSLPAILGLRLMLRW